MQGLVSSIGLAVRDIDGRTWMAVERPSGVVAVQVDCTDLDLCEQVAQELVSHLAPNDGQLLNAVPSMEVWMDG